MKLALHLSLPTSRLVDACSPPARSRFVRGLTLWVGVSMSLCVAASADVDLAMLSLEELMEIEVELVSRQPEQVSDVPVAIHVITAADLRRTGVASLPEALRLVPGMQVARVDGNKWAVSVRGFNNLFANKLLVLVDGRSVYTPVFSGVFWDAPDVVFDDVERIEVIRGPGGTLWGANAVNGIINIVTKDAATTQGTHVSLRTGVRERAEVTLRHGAMLGQDTAWRLHAKVFSRRPGEDAQGANLHDDWDAVRLGARIDSRRSEGERVLVDAGLYQSDVGQTLRIVQGLTPPFIFNEPVTSQTRGAHLLGRWEWQNDRDQLTAQTYIDHWSRDDLPALKGRLTTYDVDLQHRRSFQPLDLTWGLGWRRTVDDADSTFTVTFRPSKLTQNLASAFAHVDVSLRADLGLSVGTKIEHNDHTGLEVQPSTRLWWRPRPGHLLWSSVSRAVRTPARADDDLEAVAQITMTSIDADSSLPTLITQVGDRRLQAENLLAFEVGYRATLREDLLADVTAFYNRYDDLRTAEPEFPALRDVPGLPLHLYLPVRAASRGGGRTLGFEAESTWQLSPRWRLSGVYSWLHMDLTIEENSLDQLFLTQEEENPVHSGHVRLQGELFADTELDLMARYVSGLPAQEIPRYLTLDARVGWQPRAGLEVAVGGRHLLDSPHREFSPQVAVNEPGVVEADIYTSLKWYF